MKAKKSILTTATAVALAAALAVGGTLAYLTDSSDTVVNEFQPNDVGVTLKETTDGYDVVPGTEQEKDPTITATYTLDSYVYVVVYDNTQGLVEYEIDEAWTQLTDAEGNPITTADGGSVYFIKVDFDEDAADEEGYCTTELAVLLDNMVSYPASITAEEMAAAAASEDGINLSFVAYIIQAEPFSDAYNAWLVLDNTAMWMNVNTGVVYTTDINENGMLDEASEGDTLLLLVANSYVTEPVTVSNTVIIDLDGGTISLDEGYVSGTYDAILVVTGNLTFQNGTLDATGATDAIDVEDGGALTVLSAEVIANGKFGIYAAKNAAVTVESSSVTMDSNYEEGRIYGICGDGKGCSLTITNSTVTVTNSGYSALGVAVYDPGSTVNVAGSTVTVKGAYNTSSTTAGVLGYGNEAIVLTDSTVTVVGAGEYVIGVYGGGDSSDGCPSMNVSGCTINVTSTTGLEGASVSYAYGVYAYMYDLNTEVYVTDCDITVYGNVSECRGVTVWNCTAYVDSCNIDVTSTIGWVRCVNNNCKSTYSGGMVYVTNCSLSGSAYCAQGLAYDYGYAIIGVAWTGYGGAEYSGNTYHLTSTNGGTCNASWYGQ